MSQPPVGPKSRLQSHFDNPSQQFSAGQLGMWLFIATELLMFGGLFCAYAVFRGNHPEIFEFGSRYLDRTWGFRSKGLRFLKSCRLVRA